jgi:MFS family permease
MPFLPLFIGQLGVTDPGQIAMWTGVSLGITPAMTAILAPAWGRLGDRFGRKIMVERSLVSFVVLFAAMAYVSRAWQVLAIRAAQGLFAGYGSLSVAMAAESAPRDRMPSAIGLVQTAQRIGPGVGPLIGGALAGLVGLRRAFLVTAVFYAAGLVLVHMMYDERATHAVAANARDLENLSNPESPPDRANAQNFPEVCSSPVPGNVLAFQNFILMMIRSSAAVRGSQLWPRLPYVEQAGRSHAQVAMVSGVLFMACTGALGHHFCGRLVKRFPMRVVSAGGAAVAAAGSAMVGVSGNVMVMSAASTLLGLGIGAAMTASYSAAGSVIPAGAHGAGFGVLTSASLVGMASSPFIAGFLGGRSIRVVFLVDVVVMAALATAVQKLMVD